jgi:neutral trehalase
MCKYSPPDTGIPKECEEGAFDAIIAPHALNSGLSVKEYQHAYDSGEIKNSELDSYFASDAGVRESGHDTSYRLDGICADVATIDLNCLVHKYLNDLSAEEKLFSFRCSLAYVDEFRIWNVNLKGSMEGGKDISLQNWGSSSWAGIFIKSVSLAFSWN